IAHDRAAIGYALDDAFLLKLEQREPYVAAMGIEAVAEILLDQAFARVTPAEHDILLQTGRDDVRGRLFARAGIGQRGRGNAPRGLPRWRPPDDQGEARSPSAGARMPRLIVQK